MAKPEHDDLKDTLASVIEIAKAPMSNRHVWKKDRSKVIYSSRFGGVMAA